MQPSLTVSELNRYVKEALEAAFPPLWVQGEAADLRESPNGHLYFSLKDAQSQISVVMFRRQAARLAFRPQNGMSVLVNGRISVYEPRGTYQLVAEEIQPLGLGAIRQAIEALRERLEVEGLFSPSRKRPLPLYPMVVGVVTSPTGAAIHDILKVLREREAPVRVLLSPALVQGPEASRSLVSALSVLSERPGVDVIIIGRGGGSFEDLLAFSEESVVRAVASCPVPVISAVGHEIDVALTDLAADLRAPTPTAAAQMVSRGRVDIKRDLASALGRLASAAAFLLQDFRGMVSAVSSRLAHPRHLLERGRMRADDLAFRLRSRMDARLGKVRADLERLRALTTALGPEGVLRRGYAIVRKEDGTVVRDPDQVRGGEALGVRVAKGKFGVEVK